MARGRPRRKSLRNVSSCDVCVSAMAHRVPRGPEPRARVSVGVSAVSQTRAGCRVQPATRYYFLGLIYINISTWGESD